MKKALVVIDMQKDFVTGVLGTAESQAILPAVVSRIEEGRENGETILFTRDTHGENYSCTQEGKKLPVPHCIKDSEGWQICDGLYQSGDLVFDKPVFGSLELAKYLQEQNFDIVEFIGVCTDICVVSNVLLTKATCFNTEVYVRANCCAGVTVEKHECALETMRSCQVTVL